MSWTPSEMMVSSAGISAVVINTYMRNVEREELARGLEGFQDGDQSGH